RRRWRRPRRSSFSFPKRRRPRWNSFRRRRPARRRSSRITLSRRSATKRTCAPGHIEAERVGLIYPGTQYRVIARRFDWFQIEFPQSPTGSAWVFSGVVNLTGNAADIPEIELDQIPTIDPGFLAAQATAEFVRE